MTDPVTPSTPTPLIAPVIQPYQSYLPTAFSDDLTLLQKVNYVLNYLNTVTNTVNNAVNTVNGFATEINTDVVNQLNTWKNDGTLDTLINQNILGDVQGRLNAIEYLATDYSGVVGDGTTDITSAFNSACQDVVSKGGVLKLPAGTFVLSGYTLANITVPPIVGEGRGKTIILIHGNLQFTIANNFLLEDLTIKTDLGNPTSTVTVPSLFYASGAISYTRVRNVEYLLYNQATDGSQRSNTLFRAHTSHALFENIWTDGCRMPIVINKVAGTPCNDITLRNLLMTNSQTGVYMVGAPDLTVALADSEFIEDVNLDNVRLINTATQAAQYQAINGSDVIMFQRVRKVKAVNLYGEYACERLAYLNCCTDVRLTNPKANYTEGVKFCGYVSSSKGVTYYGDTLSIDTLTVKSGASRQTRPLTLYDVKHVYVDVINAEDPASLGSSLIDCVLLMENYCEDVHINQINCENILRGIVQLNMVFNSDLTCYIKDFYLNGINGKNVVTTAGYSAIRSIIDANFTSGYLFENINISNANVRQTYADGTEADLIQWHSTSYLQGLLNIDRVTRLRTKNNSCDGFSGSEGWLIVGANSYDVFVDEKIWSTSNMAKGYYFSQGSRIEHLERGDKTKQEMISNKITIQADSTDSLKTVQSDLSHTGDYEWGGILTYGDTVTVPWNATAKVGKGQILADSGDYMDFVVTAAGVVKIDGTTNTDIADTDTKLCVFLSSNTLTFRSRLGTSGTTKHVLFKFQYTIKP